MGNNPINFSSETLADQVNKRTAGIRQMAALMDVQRLKRQNELNRRLVKMQQDRTYGTTNAEGDNVAGTDDNITIGDQYITISGAEPQQAAPAQPVQPVAPQPAAAQTNGGGFVPAGGLLFPNQNGTPIIVNTGPATPGTGGTVAGVPVSKIWPIVASALMGSALGAGAVGYALRPAAPAVDPLRWALQFDQQAAQAAPGGVPAVSPNPTGGNP